MEVAKERMKDMVSKAREEHEVRNIKLEEKEEKKAVRTREEKEIIHQLSKARQAEAKMKYHLEKAEHRAKTLLQRSDETSRVSAQSVIGEGGGGGGDAEERPFGGESVMPAGGGVKDAVPLPESSDGTSMNGGMPASPAGGGAEDEASVHRDMPVRLSSTGDEN